MSNRGVDNSWKQLFKATLPTPTTTGGSPLSEERWKGLAAGLIRCMRKHNALLKGNMVFSRRGSKLSRQPCENEKQGKKNDNSILISLPTRLTCLRRLIHLNVDYDYLPSKLGVVVTTISSPNTISRLLTFTGSMLALSWLKHWVQSCLLSLLSTPPAPVFFDLLAFLCGDLAYKW